MPPRTASPPSRLSRGYRSRARRYDCDADVDAFTQNGGRQGERLAAPRWADVRCFIRDKRLITPIISSPPAALRRARASPHGVEVSRAASMGGFKKTAPRERLPPARACRIYDRRADDKIGAGFDGFRRRLLADAWLLGARFSLRPSHGGLHFNARRFTANGFPRRGVRHFGAARVKPNAASAALMLAMSTTDAQDDCQSLPLLRRD